MKSEIITDPQLGEFRITRRKNKIIVFTSDFSVRVSLSFDKYGHTFAWDGTISTVRLRAKQLKFILEYLLPLAETPGDF